MTKGSPLAVLLGWKLPLLSHLRVGPKWLLSKTMTQQSHATLARKRVG